jgi:phosphoribosylanthranilate isomerase
MRTRVKICGITREQDAVAAVENGADAIGLVFYAPSPRAVEIKQARTICRMLPPFVSSVALFVDADRDLIARVVGEVGVDLLQFHGDETPAYCAAHARPWIRAIRMRGDIDLAAVSQDFAESRGLLLDAYQPGVPGGTGETFDWERIPSRLAPKVVLAGGLTPTNVGEAVRRVRPFAVDVSGGVEREKGIKDAGKIKQFIDEVRNADN